VECVCGYFQLVIQIVCVGGVDNVFQPGLFLGQRIEICIRLGVVGVHFFQTGKCVLCFLYPFFNIAAHILALIQLRLLGQVANIDAGLGPRFTEDVSVDTCHDAKQG